MKRVLTLLLAMVAIDARSAYNPFASGADADVVIAVHDEEGAVVSNADVRVSFLVAPTREEVRTGITDGDGRFVAKSSRCIGTYIVEVRKKGFYDSFSRRSARSLSEDDVQRMRKWSENAKCEDVVLRAIHSPVHLVRHGDAGLRYPATNEVLRFDLERFDWCPPFGDGRHDDVHLVFEATYSAETWTEFVNNLHVTFPNGVDGFYRRQIEFPDSRFRYVYHADRRAVYEKELNLLFGRTASAVTSDVRLAKGEYLVYRVRTQTNELGQATTAHYGRIGEGFGHLLRLKMSSWFNPTVNDTNLEDARAR